MNEHELDQMPYFLRKIISTCTDISQKSSIYNNLVAMAATAVCNYSELNGWLRRGSGNQCVFINGRVPYYMKIASGTSQKMRYFLFRV
jgi:hypothetical protein